MTLVLAAVVAAGAAQDDAPRAAALSAELHQLKLDPDTCYRVRDLAYERPDIRFFFTDGWITFAKPVAGKRVVAIYRASETTDDAEVLLRPSTRSERSSLARATGSPNLNEHFAMGVFVFANGGEDLLEAIRRSGATASPERGMLMEEQHGSALRDIASNLEVRIAEGLLANTDPREGSLFFCALAGKALGSFDILYDPARYEQVFAGKVVSNPSGSFSFDVWASFRTKASLRSDVPAVAGFTLTDYRINATIEPNMHLRVVTRMKLRAQRRLSGAIPLDISPLMNVGEARVDGKPVEVFRRKPLREALIEGGTNETFLIGLPRPVEAGETREIEIAHDGEVIHKTGEGVFFVAERVNWYPSSGPLFSPFDLTFRLPKQYLLAAPGDPLDEREEGEWRIVHRRCTQPLRFAGFNIGSYEHLSVKRGDYEVEIYANKSLDPSMRLKGPLHAIVPPAMEGRILVADQKLGAMSPNGVPPQPVTTRMAALGAEIAEEFEWMASKFGPPPLKRIAVSPIPGFFGQGFPGLIYLSTVAYLDDAGRKALLRKDVSADAFFATLIHAHEVAHQWWGNLVVPASYHDDWIAESLANYTALLILEKKRGPKAVERLLDDYRLELLSPGRSGTTESSGAITWGNRLMEQNSLDPWRAIIYGKGSWIIHMMRRRMGDDNFMRMLASLRQRYEFRTLSTEQFRELAAQFLPADDPDPKLESFFDTWVYGTGIPQLEMSTSTRGKAPAVTVTVTVRQSGVPDDFVSAVPVEFKLAGGAKSIVRWVHASSEPTVLTMRLKAPPQKVELAPGLSVLSSIK